MKKFKKFDSGRSMTEMLMTLAIIGVLSVASVIGLRMAFVRHKVNLLIEDVKMAGFIVVDGMFDDMEIAEENEDEEDDSEIDLTGKFTPQSPYIFSAFREGDDTFAIVANNVPYDVCEQVRNRKVDWLEAILPHGKKNICYEDQPNSISFFFNTELVDQSDMGCRLNSDCPAERPYCRHNVCTKCEEGMLELNDGSCIECPEELYIMHTVAKKEYCHACGKSYATTTSLGCFNCKTINGNRVMGSAISAEECKRCSNMCWDAELNKCLPTQENDVFNNNGVCNWQCEPGQHVIATGNPINYYCKSCPEYGKYNSPTATVNSCHACGETYFFETNSPNTKNCYECHVDRPRKNTTKEECNRCKNRCWDEEEQLCYNSEENDLFINADGTCNWACQPGQFAVATGSTQQKVTCSDCPPQVEYGNYSMVYGFTGSRACRQCGSDYFYHRGICSHCNANSTYELSATKEECQLCTNRYFDENDKKCYLCPKGQYKNLAGSGCEAKEN